MSSALLRFYDRLRDPASQAAARGEPTVEGFDALRDHKYCLLVTYRRSGEPVPTPVWFGLDGAGRLYVRTPTGSGKVKRVRADPCVLVGPANARGKPLGPLAEGHARVLADAAERDDAEGTVQANYGLGRRVFEALFASRGEATTYLVVTPT
jgi:PPOX class probable F420-dependent enzyme